MFQSAKGKAIYMMLLVYLVYMFDYADRMIVSSLLPFIKQDWNVSDAQLGMLTSVVALFIAIFVIPISIMVDRWSRKKMIAIMVFLWSIATFMCSIADNFTQLLILRAMTGIGEAAYTPAAIALIMKTFPSDYRTRYIGIFDSAAPIGAGLGLAIGGYVGLVWGWRHAFGLVALPGIILSILFLYINDYKTQPLTNKAEEDNSFKNIWESMKKLLGIKTLWNVSIAYACCMAVNTSALVWMPSYLNRFHGMNEKTAGLVCGGVAVLVLIGAPLGGFLSDFWIKTNNNAKLMIAYISILFCAVSLTLSLWTDNTVVCIAFLLLFGVSNVTFLAPVTSIIQEVVHPGLRAVAFGLNVLIINILGSFTAPIIVGKLSDIWGLKMGMFVLPIFAIIATITLFYSKNQYFRDKANVVNLMK